MTSFPVPRLAGLGRRTRLAPVDRRELLRALPAVACAVVVAVGVVVVAGWAVGQRPVVPRVGEHVAMSPAAAVGFVLLGLGGFLLALGRRSGRAGLVVVATCVGTAAVVVQAVVTRLAGVPGLVARLLGLGDAVHLEAATAVGQLLLALAVYLALRRRDTGAHVAAVAALLVGGVWLSGYAFEAASVQVVGFFDSMGPLTALALSVLGVAVVTTTTSSVGISALLASPTAGGQVVRHLLAPALVAPAVAGWATLWLVAHTDVSIGFGLAMMCTLLALLGACAVWATSSRLRHVDTRRREVEDAWQQTRSALAERDRLAGELAQSADELRQANQDLQTFTAAAAHDLRGPLLTVDAAVELLTRPDLDPLDREVLRRIGSATRQGRRLVDDLLAYARVGTTEPELLPLDPEPLVREVMREVAGASTRVHQLELAPLPRLRADESLVRQVLTNLLGNALKYAPEPRAVRILVDAETDAGWARLRVHDDGDPIPAEEREHIFEAFRRGSNAPGRSGNGIGLAICRRAAERHGGSIAVEDAPGWSKRFVVTLPQDRPETTGASAAPASSASSDPEPADSPAREGVDVDSASR